ncbi:hypothetical protein KHQ81_06065 [Mycoplasmatota bacterium]|nr:hypothetical protein KHQ81_06065 [Mycoplasmatota bacterium]
MNYQKEINQHIDLSKNIDCLSLSIGANNKEEFSWIVENISAFKKESMEAYNSVIEKYKSKEHKKMYIIVEQKKDINFSSVEKHLGLWNKYKQIPLDYKSEDFYISESHRYAFAKVRNIGFHHIPLLRNETITLARNDDMLLASLNNFNGGDLFRFFYKEKYVVLIVRDLGCEGNALTFFSQEKQELNKIYNLAKENAFQDL